MHSTDETIRNNVSKCPNARKNENHQQIIFTDFLFRPLHHSFF